MNIETVKVKDKSGEYVIVNKEDKHLYDEYNKEKAKPVKKSK